MPKFNYKLITHIMGFLLFCNGGFMFLATAVSWIYGESEVFDLAYAGGTVLLTGLALLAATRDHQKSLNKRDGYLVVTMGWLLLAFSGMLPYIFTGAIPGISNAFFETISGYTTTGASILKDVTHLPKGVLFWRSLTHWIGGMGIIVLAVAILPLLGIGGMQLFAAESPGPSPNKLKPKIKDTAKRLWLIYVGYTVSEIILLKVAGMSLFDAVNHSFSTIATGGFSTKNASVAYWNNQPIIQYIIILFMFLAGSNFVLAYYGLKGKFKRVLGDTEFKWYLSFIGLFTLIASLVIYFQVDFTASSLNHPKVWGQAEAAFRHSLFQVVSIMTTTGFVSADYTLWPTFLIFLMFLVFLVGGSAGSTAGGIKVVRHVVMIKNGINQFKRNLHPNAILPVRFNGEIIKTPVVFEILAFFILYMLAFTIGALGFSAMGYEIPTALGSAVTALGNVGPGFAELSPGQSFASFPTIGKWWAAFLMLIGRLELITVLIFFTPAFWSNH